MSTPLALLMTTILLAGNAFFVGAEFAVTSSRRSQLEPLAEAGDARATTALWALQNVSRMLATAQLGVTLCSTGLGVVAEPAIDVYKRQGRGGGPTTKHSRWSEAAVSRMLARARRERA